MYIKRVQSLPGNAETVGLISPAVYSSHCSFRLLTFSVDAKPFGEISGSTLLKQSKNGLMIESRTERSHFAPSEVASNKQQDPPYLLGKHQETHYKLKEKLRTLTKSSDNVLKTTEISLIAGKTCCHATLVIWCKQTNHGEVSNFGSRNKEGYNTKRPQLTTHRNLRTAYRPTSNGIEEPLRNVPTPLEDGALLTLSKISLFSFA